MKTHYRWTVSCRRQALQEIERSGTDSSLGAILYAQLAKDRVDIFFDRAHTEHQPPGNLVVRHAFHQQPQDLTFTLGEWFHQWTVAGSRRAERNPIVIRRQQPGHIVR